MGKDYWSEATMQVFSPKGMEEKLGITVRGVRDLNREYFEYFFPFHVEGANEETKFLAIFKHPVTKEIKWLSNGVDKDLLKSIQELINELQGTKIKFETIEKTECSG